MVSVNAVFLESVVEAVVDTVVIAEDVMVSGIMLGPKTELEIKVEVAVGTDLLWVLWFFHRLW